MNEKRVRKNGSGDSGNTRFKQPRKSGDKKKGNDRVHGAGENSPSWLRRSPALREEYQRTRISEDRPKHTPATRVKGGKSAIEEPVTSTSTKKSAHRGLDFKDMVGDVAESQMSCLMTGRSSRRCLAMGFMPCGYKRSNGETWSFNSWNDVPINVRWEFADDYDPKKPCPVEGSLKLEEKPTAIDSLTIFFTLKKKVKGILSKLPEWKNLATSREERDDITAEVTKSAIDNDLSHDSGIALVDHVCGYVWPRRAETMVKVQPNIGHFSPQKKPDVSGPPQESADDDDVTYVRMVPSPDAKAPIRTKSWDSAKSELQQVEETRQLIDVLTVEQAEISVGEHRKVDRVFSVEDDERAERRKVDRVTFADEGSSKWPSISEGYDHLISKMRAVNPEKLHGSAPHGSDAMASGPIRPVLEWLEAAVGNIAKPDDSMTTGAGISLMGSGLKMNVLVHDADPVQLSVQSRIKVEPNSAHLVFFLAKRPPKGKNIYGVLNEAYTMAKRSMPVTVAYEINEQQLPQSVAGELPQIEGVLDSLRISFTNIL